MSIRGHLLRFATPLMGVLLLVSCAPAPTSRDGTGGSTAPSAPKRLVIAMQGSNEQDYPAPYGGSGAGSAALEHFLYAGHAPVLGGGSPLRSREPEPLSEGKGVIVRWGLKEAGATATTRRTETR